MSVWEVIYHGWHECESSDCCAGYDAADQSDGLFASREGAEAYVKAHDPRWTEDMPRWQSRYSINQRDVKP